ncbi:hypothetical protein [Methanocella arvoryzae]|nr:hypothetical protein [Methanocella arvoryzae]
MQMIGQVSFDIYNVILIIILAILSIKVKAVIRISRQLWKKTSNYEFVRKALIYSLPVAGLLGVTIPTLFGLLNLTMLGIYLAIPMISAPLIYHFVFVKRADSENIDVIGV